MNDAQREALAALVHNRDARVDKRSLNALRRSEYWSDEDGVTLQGYHAVGLKRHTPLFRIPDPSEYAHLTGKTVVLTEEIEALYEDGEPTLDIYGDPIPPDRREFRLSAEKIMKAYVSILEDANRRIEAQWSFSADREVDLAKRHNWSGAKSKPLFVKKDALEKAEFDSEFRYTSQTVIHLGRRLLDENRPKNADVNVSSSRKYSFSDTDWEAASLEAEDQEEIAHLTVPVRP